ncbi:MAG: hypothetical protein KatS3mg016_0096 [Fimbriimonadales bacterium]|nr:MAG: hypothetical protein KatS3mg016_0096 [Fimbriimonadales bacterium]
MSVQPTYPSDPTPQQWDIIEPVLKRALYGRKRKPIGAPRRYSLYDLYRAMLYVLVNGIRWRDLPRDLPPWQTVYYHFRRWQALGVFEQVQHALAARSRRRERRGQPKTVAVDSQSVPTTQKGGCVGTTVARKSKGANGT